MFLRIFVIVFSLFFCISQSIARDNSGKKSFSILYILPHPDDESYGPAAAIDKDIKAGNQVHLLTLTKGGATKMRFDLGLNIEQMNEVRYKEMLDVEKVLNLSSMTVLDFPDGGLMELDPREIEKAVSAHIKKINPDIIVTYPVHGISCHNDHIVCHAAVKRVFLELKGQVSNLKRLAFYGLTEEDNTLMPMKDFKTIKDNELDCKVSFSPENVAAAHKALDCYVTYKKLVDSSGMKKAVTKFLPFDFYMESFDTPLDALTANLP